MDEIEECKQVVEINIKMSDRDLKSYQRAIY
jgi:hypothetical protein